MSRKNKIDTTFIKNVRKDIHDASKDNNKVGRIFVHKTDKKLFSMLNETEKLTFPVMNKDEKRKLFAKKKIEAEEALKKEAEAAASDFAKRYAPFKKVFAESKVNDREQLFKIHARVKEMCHEVDCISRALLCEKTVKIMDHASEELRGMANILRIGFLSASHSNIDRDLKEGGKNFQILTEMEYEGYRKELIGWADYASKIEDYNHLVATKMKDVTQLLHSKNQGMLEDVKRVLSLDLNPSEKNYVALVEAHTTIREINSTYISHPDAIKEIGKALTIARKEMRSKLDFVERPDCEQKEYFSAYSRGPIAFEQCRADMEFICSIWSFFYSPKENKNPGDKTEIYQYFLK